MRLIKGITVNLAVKTQVSVDAFGVPIYSETSKSVENVLVSPSTEAEALETVNLYGAKAVYTLCIPKDNTDVWEHTTVEFFGETWRTIGKPLEYINDLVPLDWNKKVRVESISNA